MNPAIQRRLGIRLPEAIYSKDKGPVPQYTSSGESIQQFVEIQLTPITKNTVLRLKFNRIEFQNSGKVNCRRGDWTILANGGRDGMGSSNDVNLTTKEIILTFDSDPLNMNGNNYVEARIFILSDENVMNFKY